MYNWTYGIYVTGGLSEATESHALIEKKLERKEDPMWFLLTETEISINGEIMNPLTKTKT